MYTKDEKKKLVVEFWTNFSKYCYRKKYLSSNKRRWVLHKTKVRDVHFKFDVGRNQVQVVLEIQHRSEKQRLEVFDKLEQCKGILEQGFENGLVWDFLYLREQGKEVCRIYSKMEGVDLHRRDDWELMYAFMADNMSKLELNFLEIRDLIRD